ncbi:MAG: rhomboid family intramembrane serine protease [Lentimicrobiaceae bacterium]|nr:rhomboid family intramembrane serine protease [Lentimicrobiaceae bacterium]
MNNGQYSPSGFSILPLVVKNLLIINLLFFVATIAFGNFYGIDLSKFLGLHYFESKQFYPHQLITYMFMHSNENFGHIFFNMFALWMFGSAIENHWGGKKFLVYYLITGIGAGLVQEAVYAVRIHQIASQLSPELVDMVKNEGLALLKQDMNYRGLLGNLNLLFNISTVGASGSVFGILLAFGMMFPDVRIYLYFLFPIKAKWFVIGYGVIELWLGIANRSGDNVAHFAHLGGMLFGIILMLLWRRREYNPYKKIRFRFPKRRRKYRIDTSYRPKTDEEYNAERAEYRKQVDAVLDKVAKSGYSSLSKEEKEFLFDTSNKKNW